MKPYGISNVYRDGASLYTRSRYSKSVYDERVIRRGKSYFHKWEPKRSKLAAALKNGLKNVNIGPKTHILYLGAASGTTVSHVSDIAENGIVYAVEVSPVPFIDLLKLAESRNNIVPILDDARYPERFAFFVDHVDMLYQDVSQRDQVNIFLKNMDFFKSPEGILALKIYSINVVKKVSEILADAENMIREHGFKIKSATGLEPYSEGHYTLVVKR